MFKHMVVATDFSDNARAAYHHVVALARAIGASVTLLHVDDLADYELSSSEMAASFRSQVAGLREELMEEDLTFFKSRLTDIEQVVVEGRPRVAIPQQCEALGADLLVLSRYGFKGDDLRSSASTTLPVVSASPVPVLITKVPEGPEEPFAGPGAYQRLMVTTDFSPDSDAGLRVASSLAKRLDARLTVAHVLRRPFFAHLELPEHAQNQLRASALDRLQSRIASLDLDVQPELCVVFGDHPAHRLEALALERSPDLIIIPAHGRHARRNLIGYTTQTLVQKTSHNILVLPRIEGDASE